MSNIRRASHKDLGRIAEIEIFNYRLNFYPIFQNDEFYFDELQVMEKIEEYAGFVDSIWVYDDGAVKAFIQTGNREIKKLFVEPVLQGRGIGAALIRHAIEEMDAQFLWALEKNQRAVAFYERYGFHKTDDRRLEEGTSEYLIRLER